MTAPTTAATPRCPHFGACGGCQHQDLAYAEQLRLKAADLEAKLTAAGVSALPPIQLHASPPYEYRNRIRLRVEREAGILRLGYNIRATTDFLPITTCPIAAPILFQTAETLLSLLDSDRDVEHWLNATAELELFCNDDLSRVQATLFCAPRTKAPQGSFVRLFHALRQHAPQLAGAAAEAFDPRTGPTGRTLAEAGASGLSYKVSTDLIGGVAGIDYWITRGAFFQTNRFLLETLVDLVTRNRTGTLAWDLYAGVGLFSRVLARSFAQVTAVEANPVAAADLRAALRLSSREKGLSPTHSAVESTTLAFLERAVLQRDRPDLIVLDPPRAGAGLEACALLSRLAPRDIVYVSCDPGTLARDLAALQPHYALTALHLVDLFPQTSHIETVAILLQTN
jgi:23S rRNA (uracil1939-C5)-methyltransferase